MVRNPYFFGFLVADTWLFYTIVRQSIRPSDGPSVRPLVGLSVGWSVLPSIHPSVSLSRLPERNWYLNSVRLVNLIYRRRRYRRCAGAEITRTPTMSKIYISNMAICGSGLKLMVIWDDLSENISKFHPLDGDMGCLRGGSLTILGGKKLKKLLLRDPMNQSREWNSKMFSERLSHKTISFKPLPHTAT